ncbi:MAG: hypothetical protein LBF68_00105 [Christensenellaceae bacterium]|nr:hypothetical protein [Christensenellaceae bacterium]
MQKLRKLHAVLLEIPIATIRVLTTATTPALIIIALNVIPIIFATAIQEPHQIARPIATAAATATIHALSPAANR